MKTICSCLVVVTVLAATCSGAPPEEGPGILPLQEPLIAMRSKEGRDLFAACDQSPNFLSLMLHFETQDNLAYCGPASASMCLNASGIRRPISPDHGSYRLFTQKAFAERVEQKIAPKLRESGMSLRQFADGIELHGMKTDIHYAGDEDKERFRTVAGHALRDGYFVVVNYHRQKLKQEGFGHLAVLGAFHEGADCFLILDVSRYKYEPHWVPTSLLFDAMNTKDASTENGGRTRGYVVLARPDH